MDQGYCSEAHASSATLGAHSLLHFTHVNGHLLLHFGVIHAHEVHDRVFKLVVGHSSSDEEGVLNLGLVDKHVDHHLHFILAAHLGLLLHSHLLFHGIHGQLLRLLEGLEGLLLLELGLRLSLSHLLLAGELTLLSGHDHLSVLRVLRHHLHGHLELLLVRVGQNVQSFLHDGLAHLIFLLELSGNDLTILLPVLAFVSSAAIVKGSFPFSRSSRSTCRRHEVEKFDHVLGLEHVSRCSLSNLVKFGFLELFHDAGGGITLLIIRVGEDVVVEESSADESGSCGNSKE